MKKAFLAFAFLASTNLALAWSSSGITKINRIFTYGTFTVLALDNNTGDGEGCAKQNFVAFDTTTSGGKALYSSALTAFTTNQKIRFGVHQCYNWSGGVPKAYRIELIK